MKTILILVMTLISMTAPAQTTGNKSHELIPFYFEKSGTQLSVIFRHSLLYATTKTLVATPENDLQPNPFLSLDFLPSEKYYACASKQLEVLGDVLKSKDVAAAKNRFQSIQLTVMIVPTPAAAGFCASFLRSSDKQLMMSICLDESATAENSCPVIPAAKITAHYTKRDEMTKARQSEEARMKKAAEGVLQWMQP